MIMYPMVVLKVPVCRSSRDEKRHAKRNQDQYHTHAATLVRIVLTVFPSVRVHDASCMFGNAHRHGLLPLDC